MTRLDLLRHGEPVGGPRYRGQIDDPLSERGWAQMRAAVAGEDWEVLVSSPLLRCRAFAEALAAERGLPLEIESRFREIGFGAWEGRTAAELRAADAGALSRFYADPVAHRPPGAEPVAEFLARIAAGIEDCLQRHAGRRVLVVGHAGVIRAALVQMLAAPAPSLFRIKVPSAGLTRIEADGERPPMLIFHGRVARACDGAGGGRGGDAGV